ncbi:hypothetical protein ENUP19_0364G0005 [Entamoeba nuttalli]|uniref:Uncharacterized protein n=2 Tax=Entamoeba nuttalli TaxID=412467 RepID=K2GZH8_ENTNP|nr:hypothetical protein ENU1_131690 [Entamoeba nuttalli P19]EKE39362.1 hypothetical protein ENU1_131690 [Entamoeba nuttalli P19]|eukprot:XP_008858305.1 hypothetical protein ENU1_131690 [Entamoeba nuttalli P19]
MQIILLLTLIIYSLADNVYFYKDGALEQGFGIVNPNQIGISCVQKNGNGWIGVNMLDGQYFAVTSNNTLSTQVSGKNDYYKTLKFTTRYDLDDLDDIPLNIKIFNEDFNTLFNYGDINAINGYTVKVKHNNDRDISIKLDNFNLNNKVATIIFTRGASRNDKTTQLLFKDIRLDTGDDQTDTYENGAFSLLSTFFVAILLLSLF